MDALSEKDFQSAGKIFSLNRQYSPRRELTFAWKSQTALLLKWFRDPRVVSRVESDSGRGRFYRGERD